MANNSGNNPNTLLLPQPSLEDPEGLQLYLNIVGDMKDKDLIKLAEEVWGPGYKYPILNMELIRAELIGFLLDLNDLFQAILQSQSQSLPSAPSSDLPLSAETDSTISTPENLKTIVQA